MILVYHVMKIKHNCTKYSIPRTKEVELARKYVHDISNFFKFSNDAEISNFTSQELPSVMKILAQLLKLTNLEGSNSNNQHESFYMDQGTIPQTNNSLEKYMLIPLCTWCQFLLLSNNRRTSIKDVELFYGNPVDIYVPPKVDL